MRAQNLTVSVPAEECDKNCGYCISKITWQTEPDQVLVQRNMPKVKRVAKASSIDNVLITSKREPFVNYDRMLWMLHQFSDYWSELQTNGLILMKRPVKSAQELYRAGLNVLAISIDKMKSLNRLSETLEILTSHKITIRICINVTKMISDLFTFDEIMRNVISVGNVNQVLFRNINYPSNADKNNPAVKWINENVNPQHYQNYINQMLDMKLKQIRLIPQTGSAIFSYKGISICFSDYCIQESNEYDNIRSLIFQDNGHLYTSWSDPASILF